MSIIAKASANERNFERLPAGTYNAVCHSVWDLGVQETTWQGQKKQQHKIVISWEVNKKIERDGEYKGKRFVIGNRYTLSLSEKARLRKDLESWLNMSFKKYEVEGFDLLKLIGQNCMISVVHTENNGNTYANVSAVMAIPAGTEKMIPENGTEPPQWVIDIQAKATQFTAGHQGSEIATPQDIEAAFDAANMESELGADEIPFA
jgi:hypothetical protein